jgi:hypothetical protein
VLTEEGRGDSVVFRALIGRSDDIVRVGVSSQARLCEVGPGSCGDV